MPDIISAINFALNNDKQRLDNIAQNIANVNTQGYKRTQVSQSGFDLALEKNTTLEADSRAQLLNESKPVAVHDFSQGPLKFTGNSFNLALKGKAMLSVGESGNEFYTRKGEMIIDAQGRLSLTNGQPIHGERGFIYLDAKPFEIQQTGEVEQDDIIIDRLQLTELDNDNDWHHVGKGLFALKEHAAEVQAINTLVMQSYLESSNVDTTDEMINMIEASRHFQTSHQILKGYDQMLDDAINTIGDF